MNICYHFYTLTAIPLVLKQKSGWTSQTVWTVWRRGKILASFGNRSPRPLTFCLYPSLSNNVFSKAPTGNALHSRSKPLTLKTLQSTVFAKNVENQLEKSLPPSALLPDLEKDNYEIQKEIFVQLVKMLLLRCGKALNYRCKWSTVHSYHVKWV